MEKEKLKILSLETDLMTALNFTEADLDANRDGQLSEEQYVSLQSKRTYWRYGVIGITGFAVILSAAGIRMLPGYDYAPANIVMLFCLLFGGIQFLTAFYYWMRYRAVTSDLRDQTVAAAQGIAMLESLGFGKMTVRVGDRTFMMKDKAGLAFKNGDPYCLYYAPHSKILLSAEWLRED